MLGSSRSFLEYSKNCSDPKYSQNETCSCMTLCTQQLPYQKQQTTLAPYKWGTQNRQREFFRSSSNYENEEYKTKMEVILQSTSGFHVKVNLDLLVST